MGRSRRVEGLEVWVDYEIPTMRAWVEWFDRGVDREKLEDKVRELSEILDRYGFETWDNKIWDGYDIEKESIKKLVNELKRKGFKVKYKEFKD
jgi:hypothetical protein